MLKLFSITLLLFSSLKLHALPPMGVELRGAKVTAIESDLSRILKEADLAADIIRFEWNEENDKDSVIECRGGKIHLVINSSANEWSSTFYEGLQLLGFLFPHPRIQISPTPQQMRQLCEHKFRWQPTFSHRGFHLHTMHPNEWVQGFLMGQTKIANDTVRWMVRNGQNIFDLNLMRDKLENISKNLKEPFALAKEMGMSTGLSTGAALQQQNNYKLIPLTRAISGLGAEKSLRRNLKKLMDAVEFDFLTMEAGTSEFTSVNYKLALEWIEAARQTLAQDNRKLMVKVHVSTNQNHPDYGNFNFLPQYSHPEVGVLPHTVMFYGLWDEKVPMYGNEDFSEMRQFTLEQNNLRPTWYYPETSYWILMDMDVPLFLTDYLLVRADDMKRLSDANVQGHFNFTTGHEVGYWLIDWNVALLANKRHQFDPHAGIKLLGEDESCWQDLTDFQHEHFKKKQLIAIISFSNLQDELSTKHRIHDRNTLRELSKNPMLREQEIYLLQNALAQMPDPSCVKNQELKIMFDVTHDRIKHAWLTRMALRHKKKSYLRNQLILQAKSIRLDAKDKMQGLKDQFERYPEANLFDRKSSNLTSYSFGYLYNSLSLKYWEREEEMVRRNRYSPFYKNIYNFLDILF